MSRDHAKSVRARLLNRARKEGEDFQRLLVRYAIERLLYRLSVTSHVDDFVLKGATLFALWLGKPHRATKDLDLLGCGAPDLDRLTRVFKDISAVQCVEDGVSFDPAGIVASPIRQEASYTGVRLSIPGHVAGARFKLQVDVGMGDSVVPPATSIEMSPLLNLPAPRLFAYPPETVVAEKLEALVVLGLTTSRMKDLYDLELIRQTFRFDDTLIDAIASTFERRGTAIPTTVPVGLSDDFANDKTKATQWSAFLRKSGATDKTDLPSVIKNLREWLWPLLQRGQENSE